MRLSHIAFVLLLALFSVVSIWYTSVERDPSVIVQPTKFIRDFDFDSLYSAKIANAQGEVQLKRELAQWRVEQVYGYPANTSELSALLKQLQSVKVVELKTANAEFLHKLGLAGLNNADPSSVLLTLKNNTQTLDIVFGLDAKLAKGQYARLASSTQAVLLNQRFSLSSKPDYWLDKAVFNINYQQVSKLAVSTEQGSFTIAREALTATESEAARNNGGHLLADEFELSYPETTYTKRFPSIFSGLVRNLVQLEAVTVMPTSELNLQTGTPMTEIVVYYRAAGELKQRNIKITELGKKYWLTEASSPWAFELTDFHAKQLSQPLEKYLDTADK